MVTFKWLLWSFLCNFMDMSFGYCRGLRDCMRTLMGIIPDFLNIAVSQMLLVCSYIDNIRNLLLVGRSFEMTSYILY
jgi:hypothetical protein